MLSLLTKNCICPQCAANADAHSGALTCLDATVAFVSACHIYKRLQMAFERQEPAARSLPGSEL